MTFSRWLRTRRRTLVTLFGAVVAAIAAGTAIGLAGGSLTRDESSPTTESRPTTGGRAGATTGDSQRTRERVAPRSGVRVRIVSAILHPAGTARGRSRQRARLTVHARVTNSRDSTVALGRPRLYSRYTLLEIDPQTTELAGKLLRPLPPSSTADGRLRYETAGTITRRLTSTRRVALRFAGRTIRADVKLGSPVRPSR